jgi:hypothetical protein
LTWVLPWPIIYTLAFSNLNLVPKAMEAHCKPQKEDKMAKNARSQKDLGEECKFANRGVYLEEVDFSDNETRTYGKTLSLRVMFYDYQDLPNGQTRRFAIYDGTV